MIWVVRISRRNFLRGILEKAKRKGYIQTICRWVTRRCWIGSLHSTKIYNNTTNKYIYTYTCTYIYRSFQIQDVTTRWSSYTQLSMYLYYTYNTEVLFFFYLTAFIVYSFMETISSSKFFLAYTSLRSSMRLFKKLTIIIYIAIYLKLMAIKINWEKKKGI